MKRKLYNLFFIVLLLLSIVLIILNGLNNNSNKLNTLSGVWVADGTQLRVVIGVTDDGPIYKGNYSGPSYLTLSSDKTYYLETNNEYNTIENGNYEIGKDVITFYPNTDEYPDRLFWICNLKNNNELHCDEYAEIFVKNK